MAVGRLFDTVSSSYGFINQYELAGGVVACTFLPLNEIHAKACSNQKKKKFSANVVETLICAYTPTFSW